MNEIIEDLRKGLEPLLKHPAGGHDQKSHGNWSRGGGRKIGSRGGPTKRDRAIAAKYGTKPVVLRTDEERMKLWADQEKSRKRGGKGAGARALERRKDYKGIPGKKFPQARVGDDSAALSRLARKKGLKHWPSRPESRAPDSREAKRRENFRAVMRRNELTRRQRHLDSDPWLPKNRNPAKDKALRDKINRIRRAYKQ